MTAFSEIKKVTILDKEYDVSFIHGTHAVVAMVKIDGRPYKAEGENIEFATEALRRCVDKGSVVKFGRRV